MMVIDQAFFTNSNPAAQLLIALPLRGSDIALT